MTWTYFISYALILAAIGVLSVLASALIWYGLVPRWCALIEESRRQRLIYSQAEQEARAEENDAALLRRFFELGEVDRHVRRTKNPKTR